VKKRGKRRGGRGGKEQRGYGPEREERDTGRESGGGWVGIREGNMETYFPEEYIKKATTTRRGE